jgi:hypothetical protein
MASKQSSCQCGMKSSTWLARLLFERLYISYLKKLESQHNGVAYLVQPAALVAMPFFLDARDRPCSSTTEVLLADMHLQVAFTRSASFPDPKHCGCCSLVYSSETRHLSIRLFSEFAETSIANASILLLSLHGPDALGHPCCVNSEPQQW